MGTAVLTDVIPVKLVAPHNMRELYWAQLSGNMSTGLVGEKFGWHKIWTSVGYSDVSSLCHPLYMCFS